MERNPNENQDRLREEVKSKLAELIKEGKESELSDVIQDALDDKGVRFGMVGQTIGHNYNLDNYVIELPDGNVIFYEIGGTHRSFVEAVEVMSKEEAAERQKIIEMSEDITSRVSKATSNGSGREQKAVLNNLSLLRQQIEHNENWLKETLQGKKN